MVAATSQLAGLVRANAVRLPPLTDASFASFFNSLDLGAHKVVLLGDGSHGTSEFYSARAEITKHLIQHHGFTIVAAEADWPDAEAVDRYVRRRPGLQSELNKEDKPFKRFPTWMWRNAEMQNLVHWLRDWNDGVQEPRQRAGFYGLDLYSLDRSLEAVLKYLEEVDPEQAKVAKQRYGCIKPFAEHPERYGLAALKGKFRNCEDEVVKVCRDLLRKRLEYSTWKEDGEEFHSAEQNARLVEDAIEYYKAQYRGGAKSWNLRDQHMFDTLQRILIFKKAKLMGSGIEPKAVVWAHNSHLGDARYTEMGRSHGEFNIGQLCREHFGSAVFSLGCLSHTGTVAAAYAWGDDMEVMPVNPSLFNSYERVLHDTGLPSFVLDLRAGKIDAALREALMRERIERFIGVIYRRDTELWSHYAEAVLPKQFDAVVWFDTSQAVNALETKQPHTEKYYEETYPFGL